MAVHTAQLILALPLQRQQASVSRHLNLNPEVEVGFLKICWPIWAQIAV
jgi:hypothetical protein